MQRNVGSESKQEKKHRGGRTSKKGGVRRKGVKIHATTLEKHKRKEKGGMKRCVNRQKLASKSNNSKLSP